MKNQRQSKWLVAVLLFALMTCKLLGQQDSCWTVLLLKKDHELIEKRNMVRYSSTGFYLLRNVVYDITPKEETILTGRLIDIKKDSLFFTNFLNENVAHKVGFPLDTLAFHYSDLAKLSLIADRALGIYEHYSLSKFEFIFKKQAEYCSFPSEWLKIFHNDNELYEVVPHLTAQGFGRLFEEYGARYIFEGVGLTKIDRSNMDHTYDVRNVFWFTPNEVEKINGIAFGLMPENIKHDFYNEKDSLTINGLNLHVNPFAIMHLLNPQFQGPFPDSLEFYETNLQKDIETHINGVNISLVNNINETKIKGVNLAGAITVNDEINGLTISGLSNFAYKMNGVSIAPVNLTTKGKGVQIGLFNKATNFRGFQFGLWNKNGKRSLPFINWQFKP